MRARQLRREMTRAEAEMWRVLRRYPGIRFRRQHPIDRMILDFYAPSIRLCVEVDGGIHDTAAQKARDRTRTAALAAQGIRVIRFRNEEVLKDISAVLRRIGEAVAEGEGGVRRG